MAKGKRCLLTTAPITSSTNDVAATVQPNGRPGSLDVASEPAAISNPRQDQLMNYAWCDTRVPRGCFRQAGTNPAATVAKLSRANQ